MEEQATCPYCKSNISVMDFYCPVCGKNLKEKTLSTSISKQLFIYLLSLFLPPFGIWPAIKYLRQPDEKSKKIGVTAIILTLISIGITIWISVGILNSLQDQLGPQLENIGIY